MSVLLAGCSSGKKEAQTDADGNIIVPGTSICLVEDQAISYQVRLNVKVVPDGTIVSIEDNGTEIPDDKNGLYITSQELLRRCRE